jgi:hypothetical protein
MMGSLKDLTGGSELIKPWGFHRVLLEVSDGSYEFTSEVKGAERYGSDDLGEAVGADVESIVSDNDTMIPHHAFLRGFARATFDSEITMDAELNDILERMEKYKSPLEKSMESMVNANPD